jgi:hypothetical protein
VRAQWIPQDVMQQPTRVDICQFLALHDQDTEDLFTRLVTGEKSWLHYHNPARKNNQCNGNTLKVLDPKNFKLFLRKG